MEPYLFFTICFKPLYVCVCDEIQKTNETLSQRLKPTNRRKSFFLNSLFSLLTLLFLLLLIALNICISFGATFFSVPHFLSPFLLISVFHLLIHQFSPLYHSLRHSYSIFSTRCSIYVEGANTHAHMHSMIIIDILHSTVFFCSHLCPSSFFFFE